jgi:gamma-glutamylcyclotransferase (GGCT)/AIG2-like uncharacterized protein YtfP
MTHHLSRLLAGSALAAATFTANAALFEANVTQPENWSGHGTVGGASFTLSNRTLSALNAMQAQISGLNYTRLDTMQDRRNAYTYATASLPLQSIQIEYPGNYRSVQLTGGIQITTQGNDLSIKEGGGALSIANIRLDLPGGVAYADVNGANGVGSQQGAALWSFSPLIKSSDGWQESFLAMGIQGAVGPYHYLVAPQGLAENVWPISGLTLTATGIQLFTQALNLNDAVGVPALKSITDFGTITTAMSTSYASFVPEASTYSMMLLGLAGVMGAARSARSRRGVISVSVSVSQDRTVAIP